MSEEKVYPVYPNFAKDAWIDNDKYLAMYDQSVNDPEGFWGKEGLCVDWIKPFTRVKNTSFDSLVRRRYPERLCELPRSSPGNPWRSSRHYLGG